MANTLDLELKDLREYVGSNTWNTKFPNESVYNQELRNKTILDLKLKEKLDANDNVIEYYLKYRENIISFGANNPGHDTWRWYTMSGETSRQLVLEYPVGQLEKLTKSVTVYGLMIQNSDSALQFPTMLDMYSNVTITMEVDVSADDGALIQDDGIVVVGAFMKNSTSTAISANAGTPIIYIDGARVPSDMTRGELYDRLHVGVSTDDIVKVKITNIDLSQTISPISIVNWVHSPEHVTYYTFIKNISINVDSDGQVDHFFPCTELPLLDSIGTVDEDAIVLVGGGVLNSMVTQEPAYIGSDISLNLYSDTGKQLVLTDAYMQLDGTNSDGQVDTLHFLLPIEYLELTDCTNAKLFMSVNNHVNAHSKREQYIGGNWNGYGSSLKLRYMNGRYVEHVQSSGLPIGIIHDTTMDNTIFSITRYKFPVLDTYTYHSGLRDEDMYILHIPKADNPTQQILPFINCKLMIGDPQPGTGPTGAYSRFDFVGVDLSFGIHEYGVQLTHQDYAISKSFVQKFIDEYDMQNPTFVLIPFIGGITGEVLPTISDLGGLYSDINNFSDAQILVNLRQPAEDSETWFWSAQFLEENKYAELFKWIDFTPIMKYTYDDFLTLFGYALTANRNGRRIIFITPDNNLDTALTTLKFELPIVYRGVALEFSVWEFAVDGSVLSLDITGIAYDEDSHTQTIAVTSANINTATYRVMIHVDSKSSTVLVPPYKYIEPVTFSEENTNPFLDLGNGLPLNSNDWQIAGQIQYTDSRYPIGPYNEDLFGYDPTTDPTSAHYVFIGPLQPPEAIPPETGERLVKRVHTDFIIFELVECDKDGIEYEWICAMPIIESLISFKTINGFAYIEFNDDCKYRFFSIQFGHVYQVIEHDLVADGPMIPLTNEVDDIIPDGEIIQRLNRDDYPDNLWGKVHIESPDYIEDYQYPTQDYYEPYDIVDSYIPFGVRTPGTSASLPPNNVNIWVDDGKYIVIDNDAGIIKIVSNTGLITYGTVSYTPTLTPPVVSFRPEDSVLFVAYSSGIIEAHKWEASEFTFLIAHELHDSEGYVSPTRVLVVPDTEYLLCSNHHDHYNGTGVTMLHYDFISNDPNPTGVFEVVRTYPSVGLDDPVNDVVDITTLDIYVGWDDTISWDDTRLWHDYPTFNKFTDFIIDKYNKEIYMVTLDLDDKIILHHLDHTTYDVDTPYESGLFNTQLVVSGGVIVAYGHNVVGGLYCTLWDKLTGFDNLGLLSIDDLPSNTVVESNTIRSISPFAKGMFIASQGPNLLMLTLQDTSFDSSVLDTDSVVTDRYSTHIRATSNSSIQLISQYAGNRTLQITLVPQIPAGTTAYKEAISVISDTPQPLSFYTSGVNVQDADTLAIDLDNRIFLNSNGNTYAYHSICVDYVNDNVVDANSIGLGVDLMSDIPDDAFELIEEPNDSSLDENQNITYLAYDTSKAAHDARRIDKVSFDSRVYDSENSLSNNIYIPLDGYTEDDTELDLQLICSTSNEDRRLAKVNIFVKKLGDPRLPYITSIPIATNMSTILVTVGDKVLIHGVDYSISSFEKDGQVCHGVIIQNPIYLSYRQVEKVKVIVDASVEVGTMRYSVLQSSIVSEKNRWSGFDQGIRLYPSIIETKASSLTQSSTLEAFHFDGVHYMTGQGLLQTLDHVVEDGNAWLSFEFKEDCSMIVMSFFGYFPLPHTLVTLYDVTGHPLAVQILKKKIGGATNHYIVASWMEPTADGLPSRIPINIRIERTRSFKISVMPDSNLLQEYLYLESMYFSVLETYDLGISNRHIEMDGFTTYSLDNIPAINSLNVDGIGSADLGINTSIPAFLYSRYNKVLGLSRMRSEDDVIARRFSQVGDNIPANTIIEPSVFNNGVKTRPEMPYIHTCDNTISVSQFTLEFTMVSLPAPVLSQGQQDSNQEIFRIRGPEEQYVSQFDIGLTRYGASRGAIMTFPWDARQNNTRSYKSLSSVYDGLPHHIQLTYYQNTMTVLVDDVEAGSINGQQYPYNQIYNIDNITLADNNAGIVFVGDVVVNEGQGTDEIRITPADLIASGGIVSIGCREVRALDVEDIMRRHINQDVAATCKLIPLGETLPTEESVLQFMEYYKITPVEKRTLDTRVHRIVVNPVSGYMWHSGIVDITKRLTDILYDRFNVTFNNY